MGKYDELVEQARKLAGQIDPLSIDGPDSKLLRELATAITTLYAELAAMKEENAELITWRDAVDDHLVASCLGTWESFPDAATAMNRLLEWETTIALDPKVSKPAHDLLAAMKARGDRLAEIARHASLCNFITGLGDGLCDCGLDQALAEWMDQ